MTGQGDRFSISLLAAILVSCTACDRLDRGRQIQTQGRLQVVESSIDDFRAEHGRLPSPGELVSLCDAEVLKDAWGFDLIYELHEVDGATHYILASAGKNGELDVSSIASYIGAEPTNVDDQPASDIVIVDGRFVRNAGK